jgi:heme/copper-type cytochrome/quinol oxidase subunit 4
VAEPLSGHCASPYKLTTATYTHDVILILGDLILAVLPMFMIMNMNMTRKLKIWVVVIFSVGSL